MWESIHSNIFLFSQITKEDVDQFNAGLTIPSCSVELLWTGGEQVSPRALRHEVTLIGTKSPTFFHIRHDPQPVGMCAIVLHDHQC